jgi:hypothetical protein
MRFSRSFFRSGSRIITAAVLNASAMLGPVVPGLLSRAAQLLVYLIAVVTAMIAHDFPDGGRGRALATVCGIYANAADSA